MKRFIVLGYSVVLFFRVCAAAATLDPDLKLVTLHNGLNPVDVDADGREDTIAVGQRENYNAHGFEVTIIFVWADAGSGRGVQLQIVPLQPEDKGGKNTDQEHLELRTGGGADGLLEDFRLFIDVVHHRAVIIKAVRGFGSSFADSQAVAFEYFELTRNTEGLPGWPTLYFKSYKKFISKKVYQDVGEAFSSELDVGSDGRHVP